MNSNQQLRTFLERLVSPAFSFLPVTAGKTLCSQEWELGPRIVEDHLIYFIETGSMDMEIDGRKEVLEAGNLFWMQPLVKHHFRLVAGCDECKVFFHRFRLSAEKPIRLDETHRIMPGLPQTQTHIAELIYDQEIAPCFRPLHTRALLCRLLTTHLSAGADAADSVTPQGLTPVQKRTALDFVRNNIARRFSIAELAAAVRLNPDYFGRRFRQTFEITPQEHIKQERIRMAKSLLLEGGLNVTEVADRLGYEDVFFFSRQFKAVVGYSPRQWLARS